jgi:hypothetical protein
VIGGRKTLERIGDRSNRPQPAFPTPYSLARLLHATGTSTRRAVLLLRLEFPWISASEIHIALTGIGYPSAEIHSVLVDFVDLSIG